MQQLQASNPESCFQLVMKREIDVATNFFPSIRSSVSTDSSGEVDIFRHDGDSVSVDGAEVGVLEKSDEVSLSCLL